MAESFEDYKERVIAESEQREADFQSYKERVVGEHKAVEELEKDERPSILGDVARGAARAVGFDWWTSILKMAGDVDEAAGRRFGKLDLSILDGDGLGFDPFDEDKDVSPFRAAATRGDIARDALIDKPERVLGEMVEVISTFAIDFVGPGKLKWLVKLKDIGKWGKHASWLAQSAIADFTAFEGDSGNLSDLLISYDNPIVNNAVTQFIASSSEQNADNTAIEGRLRNALEGAVIGSAIDGIIGAAKIALRIRRTAKVKKQEDEAIQFDKDLDERMEKAANGPDDAEKLGFTEELTEEANLKGIDPTSATPGGQFHTVKLSDDVGDFFAVIDRTDDTFRGGMIMRVRDGGDVWQVVNIGVGPAEKGKGFQILLEGIDAAFGAGARVVSDTKITPRASKFFEELKGRGYKIQKESHHIADDGDLVADNTGRAIYTILEAPPGVGKSRVSSKIVKLESKTNPEDLAREIDDAIKHGKIVDLDAVKLSDAEAFRIFIENVEEAVRASMRSLDEVTNTKTLEQAQKNLSDKFGPDEARKLTASLAEDATGNLAARIVTSDILSASANKRLMAFAQKEATGQLSDVQKAAAFRQWQLAVALDAHSAGSRAEVGRALQAMSTTKQAREGATINFAEILKENQFIGKFENLMELIRKNSGDPAALVKINKTTTRTRIRQVLQEVFYGNLLGAMSTEIVNIVGNTGKLLEAILVRGSVHGYYGVKRLVTGVADAGASAELRGYIHGLKVFWGDTFRFSVKSILKNMDEKGFKISTASREERVAFFQEQEELGNFYKAILTGRGQIDNLAKFEATGGTRQHAIQYTLPADFADANIAMKSWHQGIRALTGTLGAAVRLPSKTILAVDEVFKSLNHSLEVNSIAFRQAQGLIDIGVEAGEISGIAARMIESNEGNILEKGIEFARRQTFQQELGRAGKTIESVLNKHPLLRFGVPFLRTPINLAKDAVSLIPGLNVMTRRFWLEMAEGGITRDRAVAKLILSIGLGTYVWDQWDKGLITGSRKNTNAERLGQPAPYSIFVFGKWRRYNRLDPLGMTMGFVVDVLQTNRDFEMTDEDERALSDLLYGYLAATSENFISKTYMRGVSDFIGALDDARTGNSTGLEAYGGSMLVNLLPLVGSNFERRRASGQDDFSRYAFTELDKIVARIPGSDLGPAKFIQGAINAIPGIEIDFRDREDLGARMDILGRPVEERLSQTTIMSISDEATALDKQLAELAIPLPDVGRAVNGITLTTKQYSKWQFLRGNQAEILGKGLQETLRSTFDSPIYNLLPSYKQERAIIKVFNDFRDKALDLLLAQDTELSDAVEAADLLKIQERTVDPSGFQQLIDQATGLN